MIRRRILPIALTIVVTALASLYFYETESTIREDRWLSLILVLCWSLFSLQLVLVTERWDTLRLAFLVTVIGLVFFFGSFVGPLWDWWDTPDWVAAIYRGCFLVSAPLLIGHSIIYLYANRPHWLRRGHA
jgi:hypothetical protein